MKHIIIFLLCLLSMSNIQSQTIVLDSNKVNTFIKYLKFNHSFETGGFETWKANNPDLYLKEMWYYSESFYVKRNHFATGDVMNEGSIYIPRFEDRRKQSEEVTIVIPGFRDVIVLIPGNQLIYKVQ